MTTDRGVLRPSCLRRGRRAIRPAARGRGRPGGRRSGGSTRSSARLRPREQAESASRPEQLPLELDGRGPRPRANEHPRDVRRLPRVIRPSPDGVVSAAERLCSLSQLLPASLAVHKRDCLDVGEEGERMTDDHLVQRRLVRDIDEREAAATGEETELLKVLRDSRRLQRGPLGSLPVVVVALAERSRAEG